MTNPYQAPENNETGTAQAAQAGDHRSGNKRSYVKPLLLVAVIGLAAILLSQFGDFVKLDYLATKETQLRSFQDQNPVLVYGIAFGIYVVVTGLSLPGAAALTLVYGWYFGFGPAVVLVSFASTAGATVAFLTSRYLLRESVQSKFGPRLQSFNRHLEQEGAFYLFTLRLVPLVPFFVINLVMGLTALRARTFWWVSQVGMLPGTLVYVYAGSSVPNLSQLADKGVAAVFSPSQGLQLALAFTLLGIFPIAVKYTMKYFTSARRSQPIE
jgi:uncharacterized membrane protein YdjX (TVP38/TMEM64 family)